MSGERCTYKLEDGLRYVTADKTAIPSRETVERRTVPKAIYQQIYQVLKEEIISGHLPYQSLMPSEHDLCEHFQCSRSSVRRALSQLAAEGFVQPMQGKGVRVIYNPLHENPRDRNDYGLETYQELSARRGFAPSTRTVVLERVITNPELSQIAGFAPGSELTHILRVRYADGRAVGTDESYYLASSVPGLTTDIVNRSIYQYLEDELGMSIVTSKRIITIEPVNRYDETLLDLDGFNAIAVMRCNAYDTNGIMIEYTETRQVPGFFELCQTSQRTHAPRKVPAAP